MEQEKKDKLHLTVMEDHAAIAKAAAHRIVRAIKNKAAQKPEEPFVLGLATGATMEPVYAELVRMHRDGEVDFSKVHFFNLDHYKDLPSRDRNSYDNQLRRLLLEPIGAREGQIHLVHGVGFNPEAYEAEIKKAGGIDIQLLGLGGEGHIGFNEVGSTIDSRTRVVDLQPRTLEDNAMYFNGVDEYGKPETVPPQAYTMGIGTILEAREIIVLANNPNKAWTVRNLMDESGKKSQELTSLELAQMNKLNGKIDMEQITAFLDKQARDYRKPADPVAELPARALHSVANKVTLLVDREAASMTRVTDLLNHSNLKPEEVRDLVDEFSPKQLTLNVKGQQKTLLLPPGFDFYDPKVMELKEKFDPKSRAHVEALERALSQTTDVGVGAHQDDIEIMAGPMLLEATRNPDKKWMTVIVTDGAASKSVLNGVKTALTPKELTQLRHMEQREAAKDAGTPVIQLKYPSAVVNQHMGSVKKEEAAIALGTLFAAMPNVERVFGHNPIDKHATHLGTFSVQTAALRAAKPPKLKDVYAMEVWGGLTGVPESMLSQFPVQDGNDLVAICKLVDRYQTQIVGQGRQYSIGVDGRMKAHAAFVTSPHGVNPPAGMVIGLNVTDFTKGEEQNMGALARDILTRAAEIKTRFAEKHPVPHTPDLAQSFAGAVLRNRGPVERH